MQNRTAIETIKQKLPIESVVGSYVKLDKVGIKFKACCPFHNEKTPSFQVDPDRQFYYCFGCHKGGDIFNFVQEIEGIEFYDALKLLAEKAGVELTELKNEKPSRSSVLREIVDQATKLYEVGLRTNKPVVDYLLSRGLTKETMIKWRIGYAVKGWSHLYDFLKKKKYNDEDLVATGLCLKSDKGRGLYDRFRERITFPINDHQGRVIAFSARVMPGTDEASRPVGKYINSPETELYHKSRILFGFDKAKNAIHQMGFAILVEGQMDCIMAHQAGFAHTVALSGTACTDEQITQLVRFTNEIAIALDADAAGLAAAQKSAMVAYRHGMKVSIIDIPNGKDPADAILEDIAMWKNAIDQRTDYITFRLQKMREGNDKIQIATKELFPVLQQMQFQMSIDEKLQEIAKSFGVSAASIRADFERYAKGSSITIPIAKLPELPDYADAKQSLRFNMIAILLAIAPEPPFNELKQKFEDSGLEYAKMVAELPTADQARLVSELEKTLGSGSEQMVVYEKMFHQFHTRYHLLLIDEQKHSLDITLHANPNDTEALAKLHALLREKDRLIHLLHNR